jgi:spore maturation protein CgeB
MRVIIIQEAGRHEENREFRECLSLQRAFIYNGHECDVWGLGHSNYNQTPNWNSYDLIMNIENYDSSGWVPNLYEFNSPLKILWSIDAHCRGEDIYENTFFNGGYNFLLHSSRDFVKKEHHIWFPNCFDDDLIKPIDIQKKYQIGFCGNYVNRKDLLDWMSNEYGMKQDIFVIGDSMVKSVNEYKIHFNKNMLNDVNYRNFETIGTSTVLLTSYHQDYELLGFINEKNCIIYKSIEDLKKIMKDLEMDLFDLEKIGMEGYELSKIHTYKIRVKHLIDKLWKK